jgi:CubicO group peptidase (beta-lactamase class C family)
MMLLVERGLLSLDDPVQKHLPGFAGGDRPFVLVRHLLSHISGLPDMVPTNLELRRAHAPLSEFVADALTCPLLFPPGTGFSYQSAGVLLAAEIVESISGLPLREFQQNEIFHPLGMKHSALGLGTIELESTVRVGVGGTAASNPREEEEYGGNSPYWRDMGHPWGGMHSSAEDLSILLRALLNGGSYGGRTIWSPAAVRAMITNQNGAEVPEAPWGLGWGLRDSLVWNFFGELVSAKTFGHVGATGTVAWADPISDVTCVILMNQMVEEGALLKCVSNAVAGACDVVDPIGVVESVEAWSYSSRL